jgi:transcriptional regulator with XRE-family HTH domain
MEDAMKDLTKQLVTLIRKAEARGVTRYRLAKVSGVSASQLSKLLSGKRGVSVDTLATLADALGYELRFCKRGQKDS